MRERELAPRMALADFNSIQIKLRSLESRYTKDCITTEEMSEEIQKYRQLFIEKANEMTSIFKNKFFKESTLLSQEYIMEAKTSVKDFVAKADKDLKVLGFKRLELGA